MDKKLIFVITPIGEKNSEKFKKYDAVFKTMIKPAVDNVDSSFKILRADHISQPGSFIKDILEHIQNAYIVIANLTDLNPNVFYELGVRHAISNRTIMITEDINSLPSDLKEYRAIPYYPDITTIEEFKENLENTLNEIIKNPDKSDNPVQDRLPYVIESKQEQYTKEIEFLRKKLESKESSTKPLIPDAVEDDAYTRIKRILNLMPTSEGHFLERGPTWKEGDAEDAKEFKLSKPEDGFDYYYMSDDNEEFLDHILIMNIHNYSFNLNSDLANIRVMLTKYKKSGTMKFKFIIGCNEDLSKEKEYIDNFFNNALKQAKVDKEKFQYEIWDKYKITEIEEEIGIKMKK